MPFGKSDYDKAVKDEKKDARTDAREAKKDARQEAREEKKDAREEKREDAKAAREDKRAAVQEAREAKREEMKEIRHSDLEGKEKRDAKSGVREDKRDATRDARDEKKLEVRDARVEKKDEVENAEDEKRAEIKDAKADKKAALEALRVPKAFDRKWKSYLEFQEVDAVEIFKPENLEDLKAIFRVADELDLRVRAIGSGHSFSDIGVTNDFFVLTKGFNRLLPLTAAERQRRLKAQHHENKKLVELEVGIEIFELSNQLYELDLALANQGTYDGQTFWGVVSTSTHGTGITRAPLPDMVRSVVLVTEKGRTLRIEPADGITDPKDWKEPGIDELIQNDDTFYSVICSMGCMGIAYSTVIEARGMYWIDEWSFVTTWEDFKREFSQEGQLDKLLNNWEMVSLLVSPIKAEGGERDGVDFEGRHPCSILIREESNQRREFGFTGDAQAAKWLENHCFMNRAAHDSKHAYGTKVLKDSSKLAVLSYGKHGWEGMDANQTDHAPERRLKCFEMFPQGGKIFGGFAVELACNYHETFTVMDKIIKLAEQRAGDHPRKFFTAPVAVRFVAPSKAYLSPQYGRKTVMFEVLMMKGTHEGKETLEKIEDTLLELNVDGAEDRVRVHWGLEMSRLKDAATQLAGMYPRWAEWLKTYEEFNVSGTFNNSFTRRLGISR
jgi:L-gulono-1,4-lactone dehydrogenase